MDFSKIQERKRVQNDDHRAENLSLTNPAAYVWAQMLEDENLVRRRAQATVCLFIRGNNSDTTLFVNMQFDTRRIVPKGIHRLVLLKKYQSLCDLYDNWFMELRNKHGVIYADGIHQHLHNLASIGTDEKGWKQHGTWSDHSEDQKGIEEIKKILPFVNQMIDLENEYEVREHENLARSLCFHTLEQNQNEGKEKENKIHYAAYSERRSYIRDHSHIRVEFGNELPLRFTPFAFIKMSSYFATVLKCLHEDRKCEKKKGEANTKKQKKHIEVWVLDDRKIYEMLKMWRGKLCTNREDEITFCSFFDYKQLSQENVLDILETAHRTLCFKIENMCENFILTDLSLYSKVKLWEVATNFHLTKILEKLSQEIS